MMTLPNPILMHGLGNRFAILDLRGGGTLTDDGAKTLASQTGVDQVLTIEPGREADVYMGIWNADGSRVAACGNGTRCVAWHVLAETGGSRLVLETDASVLMATVSGDHQVSVDMGVPKLDWPDIPLAERMDTRFVDIKIGPIDAPILMAPTAVNMGNPHVVFFVEDIDSIDIPGVGPLIEWHPLLPEGANVGFATLQGPADIRLRVWERGAGLTQACGTGACAALVAAHRLRRLGREATVHLDGGDLHVTWRDDDHVIMTGPVAYET